MTEQVTGKYLTTSELEDRFKREVRSIRRWEKSKNFPPPVITGVGVENLWLREQVEQWEMSQAAKTGWAPQEVKSA